MAVATIKVSSEKQGGELQKVVELLGGARTLSRRLTNALNAHELLLSGLPACGLIRQVAPRHGITAKAHTGSGDAGTAKACALSIVPLIPRRQS